MRQRILINTHPIHERMVFLRRTRGGPGTSGWWDGVEDILRDPFPWCYLYGLLIHKVKGAVGSLSSSVEPLTD